MPAWVQSGFEEYARRLPHVVRLELIEVKPEKRTSSVGLARAMALEEARIEAVAPAGCYRIVLDERGAEVTSAGFAHQLQAWRASGRDIALIIGGADGLTPRFRKSADALLALSRMTLPHGLVRVMIAEQLYRAFSIMHNHPYHRE